MPAQSISKPRLAIVVSHPTQYYSPWFRWLAQNAAVDLRVFYLWEFGVQPTRDPRFGKTFSWDVDLLSGYGSEFVPNVSRTPGAENFGGFNNPGLPARLAGWKPDALLLFGYKWKSHLRAVAWARSRGVPIIFRGDSHLLGRSLAAGRAMLIRVLFRQFAAFLSVGKANREYFTTLGVPDSRIFFSPHAVNSDLFNPDEPAHRQAAAALRASLAIPPDSRIVLFAGKFVAAKQPVELAAAFLALKPAKAALVLVGDGEERPRLEALAAESAGSIHLLPFANQSEMPARYLLGDVFALPSRGNYETWGLAVNEAMHMGRPCLVSDRVGCQRDLVTDGETGWVFPADNPASLREKLSESLRADVARMRAAVLNRISGYSYAAAATGLEQALAQVVPKGPALRGREGEAG